jgi:hypothetical protein
MSSDKFIRSLVFEVTEGKWTREEFMAMDRKVLRRYATYNGLSQTLTPEMAESIKSRGWTSADRTLAISVLQSSDGKTSAHVRPESFLNVQGGQMFYTPTQVTYVPLSGVKQVRANAAIPARFGEAEVYRNVQAVTALVSNLLKNDSGQWVSSINLSSWLKVYGQSGVRVEGLTAVSKVAGEILSQDRVWTSLSTISRNSIQGPELLVFVRQALDRTTQLVYDVLNTMIVCDVFDAFRKVGNQWIRVMDGQKPVVPDSVFEKRPPTPEAKEVLSSKYPGLYWYLGGYIPRISMPIATGDLKSARDAASRLREVQGGDTAPTALLAGMRDFSGLTDILGKKIQYFLAATLSAWASWHNVDIKLETVGDIPLLVASLNYWRKHLMTTKVPNFFRVDHEQGSEKETTVYCPCDFALILPKISDRANVPMIYRPIVYEDFRPNTTVIFWSMAVVPTETSGAAASRIEYDRSSMEILPRSVQQRQFIAYCPIYGAIPFWHDPDVQTANANSTVTLVPIHNTVFVYKFGNSSGFRGILSTLPNLCLYGFGSEKVGKGYDLSKTGICPVPLVCVPKQKDWYLGVCQDINIQAISFLCPISRYSPISNLPFASRGGVMMANQGIDGDEGVLVANQVRIEHRDQVLVKVASGWDDPPTTTASRSSSTHSSQSELGKSNDDTSFVLPSSSSSSASLPIRPIEEESVQYDVFADPPPSMLGDAEVDLSKLNFNDM